MDKTKQLKCPKCGGEMEIGTLIADRGAPGTISILTKFATNVKRSFWWGLVADTKTEIKTYHCKSCGYLESYAN